MEMQIHDTKFVFQIKKTFVFTLNTLAIQILEDE